MNDFYVARDGNEDLTFFYRRPIYEGGRWVSSGRWNRLSIDMFPQILPGQLAVVRATVVEEQKS